MGITNILKEAILGGLVQEHYEAPKEVGHEQLLEDIKALLPEESGFDVQPSARNSKDFYILYGERSLKIELNSDGSFSFDGTPNPVDIIINKVVDSLEAPLGYSGLSY